MNDLIIKRIRDTRLERDYTQQELATFLGKTAAAISELERGKVQVSANDLHQIAKFLGKPVEYFYGEDFIGDDVQALIAIIRRMPPEIRENQVGAIAAMLQLQVANDELISMSDADEETQKEHAKEIYNHLSIYLIQITEMRDQALKVKAQLEEILGITS